MSKQIFDEALKNLRKHMIILLHSKQASEALKQERSNREICYLIENTEPIDSNQTSTDIILMFLWAEG